MGRWLAEGTAWGESQVTSAPIKEGVSYGRCGRGAGLKEVLAWPGPLGTWIHMTQCPLYTAVMWSVEDSRDERDARLGSRDGAPRHIASFGDVGKLGINTRQRWWQGGTPKRLLLHELARMCHVGSAVHVSEG